MIELKNVKKEYDKDVSIDIVDFTFQENTSYCILGPSGVGKSTLLNMMSGLLDVSDGEIKINDFSMLENETKRRAFRYADLGYIKQDPSLLQHLTVQENIEIMQIHTDVKLDTVLDEVGLLGKRDSVVRTLSGGERQRVSVARALMKKPKVMLCDEPTGALNTKLANEIMDLLIAKHKEQGNILIVVTHNEKMSDKFDVVLDFERDLLVQSERI